MDVKEINYRIIPFLVETLFPKLLMGEEIEYYIDDYGFIERVNRDLSINDKRYKPNKLVNVDPKKRREKINEYFKLSNYTVQQLEHIFRRLDKELIVFERIGIENFVSYDWDNKIKFKLIKAEIINKRRDLIENYNILKKEILNTSNVEPTQIIEINRPGNDFLLSTIEDYLNPFKENNNLDDTNYKALVSALHQYFTNSKFPKIIEPIKVTGRVRKKLGWALNSIFRDNNTTNKTLPLDYLEFAKQNISIFLDVNFDKNNYLRSNLYKYFKSKSQ